MTIYKAPDHTPLNRPVGRRVFLCGSIEMGAAENWQATAGRILSNAGLIVLDPRRDDWDSSWEQTIENEEFAKQVRWELQAIEKAEGILVHFDPQTKSPITLLELGLVSQLKPSETVVSCPDGYWRQGNVEIVCNRYSIVLFNDLESAIGAMIRKVAEIEGEFDDRKA